MRKQIDSFIPGLVIMPDGRIIPMKEENHAPFFQRIITSEYDKMGVKIGEVKEDNLATLIQILLNEFHILPYVGCTSGDRHFTGGNLFIQSIDQITEEQFPAIMRLYNDISSNYSMNIIQTSASNPEDQVVSLGDIYLEQLERSAKYL